MALAVTCGVVSLGGATASAATSRVLSPLKRGLDFYRGSTITLICPATPGGGFDLFSRAVARYMSIYLHATINVVNNGTASGTPAQNELAAAKPDGLTFGVLNLLNDAAQILTQQPGLSFNPAREEYIASSGAMTLVLISTPSSPYTSFASLKRATPPFKTLVDVPGTGNTVIRVMFGVFGIHTQYVAGYTSAAAVLTGFIRGDGPVTAQSLSSVGPLIQSGVARPLAVSVRPPAGTGYRSTVLGVPTIAELLKQYPPKTKAQRNDAAALVSLASAGNPIVTQTAVADYKLAALRAAAAWALRQPGYKAQVLAAGQSPAYVDPVHAKGEFLTMIHAGAGVECFIGGTC